jgi:regulator of replication initiation timing|tara:strand:+ start:197 stop:376 length:180 start_codon:yes stop_codon:yes gene_type:complete
MEIEIKQEDIQSVMQANPLVALQIENQALKRKLSEITSENKRLLEELASSKNGKSPKEK